MTIGLFVVWRGNPATYVMADMLIRSAKRVMPDVPLVQQTDETSPALYGVDRVIRRAHPQTAMLRIEHQIACEGDWLFVDSDVLVQQDVRSVFDEPFDVAISDRVGCVTDAEGEEYELYRKMPHNSGIVFSRSPAFWKAVLHHMQTIPPEKKEWLGDQYAVCDVIATGQFHVKILPGRLYNCPPLTESDRCEEAAIVHFKGTQRKNFMLKRFAEV